MCLVVALSIAFVLADDYKAPSYDKNYDGYFQYANIPAEHEYEFGYKRGNKDHYTSRYEQAKDWRFRTKVTTIHSLYLYYRFTLTTDCDAASWSNCRSNVISMCLLIVTNRNLCRNQCFVGVVLATSVLDTQAITRHVVHSLDIR